MGENTLKYGYAGKILRLNLTNFTTEIIPSEKYLPEYIGGRALGTRIFWDEVAPGVKAFDPENKLIFATGPTTGTGIPTGGRSEMVGISPNSLPEQFSYGGMGGFCGTALKYAGYDAFIIEGKAPRPTYILIDDDKVSFLNARNLWGMLIHDTQRAISLAHGNDVYSMAIGPAGENLVRNSVITTSADFTFSKSGFGAVFGSKNLKAVAIHGTGKVIPADPEKVLALRWKVTRPQQIPQPTAIQTEFVSSSFRTPCEQPWTLGHVACSPGCNAHCQKVLMDMPHAFTGKPVSQIEKCVSGKANAMDEDVGYHSFKYINTPYNNIDVGVMRNYPYSLDKNDPDYDLVSVAYAGDKINYTKPNFEKGCMQNQLCCEYGIDKWDVDVWYIPWLSACKQEGRFEDIDFGMEVDVDNPAFIRHFMELIVRRSGPEVTLADGSKRKIGDVLGEGLARAIRMLGKEKFGDTPYNNRYSADGKKLEIPVSLEAAWGAGSHWQGRGFNGTPRWLWIFNGLSHMANTRDAMSSGHPHLIPEEARKVLADPDRSPEMAKTNLWNQSISFLKDSVTSCEWQSPNRFWPTMETEMFEAATGEHLEPDEIVARMNRARLIARAILMRNFGRTRDLEVENVYPFLTYPDPWGERTTWEDWNDTVDVYYKEAGYDLKTGWPLRRVWEEAGLSDVADELDKYGMVPADDNSKDYVRKPNPFKR